MATSRDYYEVLGVEREATAQEIKSAYRKAAVRWHPDRNPGDAEAEASFKEAAEAYSVLSDPQRRAGYDRFGHRGVAAGGFSGFDPETFGDFADILGQFFGIGFGDLFGGRRQGPRGRRPRPGADLRYELHLSLEEAASGIRQTLKIPRLETCEACQGSGGAAGSAPVTCSACQGRGQVRYSQGFLSVARTCPQCGGEGQVITDPCPECRGRRRVERERRLEVDIPAGVDTGNRLRLAGEGEDGLFGGGRGDLFVDLRVDPHPELERRGVDIFSRLPVHYAEAVLGARLEIDTLQGRQEIEVPAGTAAGSELRLRGLGMPRLGGRGRGDHIARLDVEIPDPRTLSDEQVELLKRLAELDGRETQEGRSVFERVKDLFA
ncbi:MAG: molecular chaperone DnaJ [Thermoanaerobaculia bacterium]